MAVLATFPFQQWLRSGSSREPVKTTKPEVLSYWTKASATAGGLYTYGDDSGLGLYTEPTLPADLNVGFPDSYIRKPDSDHAPAEIIALAALEQGLDTSAFDVVTFRNNLNKIGMTPLFPANGWAVDAILLDGGQTLFLDIVKLDEDNRSYPNQELFMYYGYKFEALCTAAETVDATSEFAIVVGYSLGSHRLLMAAEVDCCEDVEGGGTSFLELKTIKIAQRRGQQEAMYRDKYPRWWLQSFLAGVPTVVLGQRDEHGTLQALQRLDVQRLPSLAAAQGATWNANQLLRCLHDVLAWMRRVAGEHRGVQLRFSYLPAQRQVVCAAVEGQLADRLGAVLRSGTAGGVDGHE